MSKNIAEFIERKALMQTKKAIEGMLFDFSEKTPIEIIKNGKLMIGEKDALALRKFQKFYSKWIDENPEIVDAFVKLADPTWVDGNTENEIRKELGLGEIYAKNCE